MAKLHFDIRDLFRAIRLGWSGKKIWAGLCGLVLAWAGYSVLVLLGYSVSGVPGGEVWHRYGLFPGANPGAVSAAGAILHVLAMVFGAAVIFFSSCLMCKITYQQLRGDDFYSSGDAFKFLREHWGGVVFGPVAVLALVVFFVVTGIVIGWVAGVIPVAGEVLFAASFVPLFFAALVAVFMAIALVTAALMSPAIVGTVGEDTLEVVIQAFSLSWSQPWRMVLYVVFAALTVAVGATTLSAMMVMTLGLVSWACGLFMDGKLDAMLAVAQNYLPPIDFTTRAVAFADRFGVGREALGWTWPAEGEDLSGSLVWSGRLLGLMLILLTGVWMAYVQAVYASAASLIYVILRRKKDDENLLEWEDPAMEEPLEFDDDKDEAADKSDAGKGEPASPTQGEGAGAPARSE